jgi:signal peptidase
MSDVSTPPELAPTERLRPRDGKRRAGKKPPKKKGVLHYVGLGLSAALLLFVILLAALLIVVPKIAGATPLTILTNSMAPGLPPGTLIYVLPIEPDDVQIGDVITYQIRSGYPDLITHRVIGISPGADGDSSFILQGDNNGAPDDPIRPEQIQARLWYSVPYMGFVNSTVNGENRAWIIPVIATGLIAYAAFLIIGGVVQAVGKSRKKRAGDPPAEPTD